MSLLLGAIADDFTGATDLASQLTRQGMRTVQLIGVPGPASDVGDAQAVVIALKSRTIPAGEAVSQSLEALRWLQGEGVRQILFKYCSTFDSSDEGNIGPVAEALLDALGADFTIACPAAPENGRSVYLGHLFVGESLLSDTHMRHHPLTPMTDSNLVKVLQRQSRGKVGLVPFAAVNDGAKAIAAVFADLRQQGVRMAIVDAVSDAQLYDLGTACAGLTLITGGSGVAIGLPENFRRQGLLDTSKPADALPRIDGHTAVLAGSCSVATLEQVAIMEAARPTLHLDAPAICRGEDEAARALTWASDHLGAEPILIASSATAKQVAAVQKTHGRDAAGEAIEAAMATIARGLVERGVRRLVVAGGETSGAVISALGVTGLMIGPVIDPGVPWTVTLGEPRLAVALKSGNFGTPDFFLKAFRALP